MKTKSKKINPPKGGNTEQVLTKEQVEWLDKCTKISWATRGTWQLNPQTGLVDVDGDFDCSYQELRDLKGVRFGVVEGNFDCYKNQLTSLEGAPREVRGNFSCEDNELTSLEGAPREVRGNFSCEDNELTSLEGAPQVVGGDFYCFKNQLTSLEGAPQKVGWGYFYCGGNPVPETTLKSIFSLMKRGKSYQEALESLWSEIPQDDKSLLWRPEFKWVDEKEIKTLKAMGTVNKLKGMI
jgi:hypothetical protein